MTMLGGQTQVSESGAYAIHSFVGVLIADGDLVNAERWARRALAGDGRRCQVAMQLANIYYRTGRRAEFFALLESHLEPHLDRLPESQRLWLERMSAALRAGITMPLIDAPGDVARSAA